MEQRSTQPDSTQHRQFNVGDRVRSVSGTQGVVTAIDDRSGWVYVTKDDCYPAIFRAAGLTAVPPMSQPARTLLAAWRASGRTLQRVDRPNSPNRANINWGMARRRYCTPDGSIDLTLTTEVK